MSLKDDNNDVSLKDDENYVSLKDDDNYVSLKDDDNYVSLKDDENYVSLKDDDNDVSLLRRGWPSPSQCCISARMITYRFKDVSLIRYHATDLQFSVI